MTVTVTSMFSRLAITRGRALPAIWSGGNPVSRLMVFPMATMQPGYGKCFNLTIIDRLHDLCAHTSNNGAASSPGQVLFYQCFALIVSGRFDKLIAFLMSMR